MSRTYVYLRDPSRRATHWKGAALRPTAHRLQKARALLWTGAARPLGGGGEGKRAALRRGVSSSRPVYVRSRHVFCVKRSVRIFGLGPRLSRPPSRAGGDSSISAAEGREPPTRGVACEGSRSQVRPYLQKIWLCRERRGTGARAGSLGGGPGNFVLVTYFAIPLARALPVALWVGPALARWLGERVEVLSAASGEPRGTKRLKRYRGRPRVR